MEHAAGGELVKQRERPGLARSVGQGRLSQRGRDVLLNRVSKWAKVSYYEL